MNIKPTQLADLTFSWWWTEVSRVFSDHAILQMYLKELAADLSVSPSDFTRKGLYEKLVHKALRRHYNDCNDIIEWFISEDFNMVYYEFLDQTRNRNGFLYNIEKDEFVHIAPDESNVPRI